MGSTGRGGHCSPMWTKHAQVLTLFTAIVSVSSWRPHVSQYRSQSRGAVHMTTAKADVESARLSGLALALDDGTRKSHSVAQNTAFVTGFFRGIATTTSYAQLLSSLFFVYEAMENAMDETVDLNVKAMDFPELRRVQALEEDMLYFFGDNWRAEVEPSRATQEYVERIEQVAREEPYLLVGHMYTRYLGDLFGGQ